MINVELLAETALDATVTTEAGTFSNGIFPGLCVNPDGTLAMLFVSGSGFESADQRLAVFTGTPDGMSWQNHGFIDDVISNNHPLTSMTAKPTLLSDGSILALGYGYERTELTETISGYAEKHGNFPPVKNLVWFSQNGGKSYSPKPLMLEHQYSGVEFSGPALRLRDNRLLAFGPPFTLEKHGQIGCCFESSDNGKSWHELSRFFEGDTVTAWESRALQLQDGRIAVVFWAFDLMNEQHLANKIAVSSDGAHTWNVIDTGLPGQASNLCNFGWKNGNIGLLQARREGNEPGLYLSSIYIADNSIDVEETVKLYDAAGGANVNGAITEQFYNLKFGQPAIHHLTDGSCLLVFWRCNASGKYEIVIKKYSIN